jgi:phospholipid N-methyltransferase
MPIETLKKCTVEGNIVKLPEIQLDRKDYTKVKKALELIGGKWKGGSVAGFVFPHDPTDLLSEIANGGKRNLKKEFQFFPTPKKIAQQMVYYADIQPHESVLEPSAGQGSIIKEINTQTGVIPHFYELMDTNMSVMKKDISIKGQFVAKDYLKENNGLLYDKIIANPPFSKNQDIDHIEQMYSNCKVGGMIVTLCSKHWTLSKNKKETHFRNFIESLNHEILDVEAGEFKESGTNISMLMLIIKK